MYLVYPHPIIEAAEQLFCHQQANHGKKNVLSQDFEYVSKLRRAATDKPL